MPASFRFGVKHYTRLGSARCASFLGSPGAHQSHREHCPFARSQQRLHICHWHWPHSRTSVLPAFWRHLIQAPAFTRLPKRAVHHRSSGGNSKTSICRHASHRTCLADQHVEFPQNVCLQRGHSKPALIFSRHRGQDCARPRVSSKIHTRLTTTGTGTTIQLNDLAPSPRIQDITTPPHTPIPAAPAGRIRSPLESRPISKKFHRPWLRTVRIAATKPAPQALGTRS